MTSNPELAVSGSLSILRAGIGYVITSMCGHWRRMYGKKLGKELRLYVLKQASRTGKSDCGPRREGRRDWPRALLQRRIRTTSTRKVQA